MLTPIGTRSAVNWRRGWPLTVIGAFVIAAMAGCGASEGLSPASQTAAIVEEPHTHVDVLFARDIIDHSAQAVEVSNLILGKEGVAPEVADIARQIGAGSTSRISELQALLVDWGFVLPTTIKSIPPIAAPGAGVQTGEHPLASDADIAGVRDAIGSRATDTFLDLMIRQHQFVISAARDQLQSGLHPGAIAIARALIDSQQAEIALMERLRP